MANDRESLNEITSCPDCDTEWDFWYGEDFADGSFINYYLCSECKRWFESDDGKTIAEDNLA